MMGRKQWMVWVVVVLWGSPVWAETKISPSFLGMYRKTMEVEREFVAYATRYGVDSRLARAVMIQESGGNANLVSSAGARGYFQVMPSTFRMLRVTSNLEAGVKYLSQMQQQFGREDYAIAAYNAGPGTISKDRPLRLETLQYVIGVGSYKSVLRLHELEVRRQAKTLKLQLVGARDSWEAIAQRTGIPVPLLRLYNPFLAPRSLTAGSVVVYPPTMPADVLEFATDGIYYTSRIGDSYLNLALVFGVDLETFRRDNDLWRLQQLPVGVRLRVPLADDSPFHRLQQTKRLVPQTVTELAEAQGRDIEHIEPQSVGPLSVLEGREQEETENQKAKARPELSRRGQRQKAEASLSQAPAPTLRSETKSTKPLIRARRVAPWNVRAQAEKPTYTVRRGDTLEQIARRYRTTVEVLMRANRLTNPRVQAGVQLRVPGGRDTGSSVVTQQRPHRHTVRRGETLAQIARRYGTDVRTLMSVNKLRSPRVQPGVALRIPGR